MYMYYNNAFLHPATQKVVGYYVIPSENFECLSFRPSICPSALRFRTLTCSFWPIFFKLCMDIDIGEEWFWDCKWAKFVYKQQSYGPWLM